MRRLSFKGLLLSIVLLLGCVDEGPVIEIPETNQETQKSLSVLAEVISSFDIVQDVVSSSEFFVKKNESFLPSEVKFIPIDTSYQDGDGIELILDFGGLGDEPHGLLCKDEKYRAGTIKLSLDKPYNKIDAVLTVEFPTINPYYSGDGSAMNKLNGTLKLTRISDDEVKLTCSKLSVRESETLHDVVSNLSIRSIKDVGLGLVNDELTYSGEIVISTESSNIVLVTTEPLLKTYTLDCAKHIIKGKFDVELTSSASEIEVDFDPYQDLACDNEVAITANGKRVIFKY